MKTCKHYYYYYYDYYFYFFFYFYDDYYTRDTGGCSCAFVSRFASLSAATKYVYASTQGSCRRSGGRMAAGKAGS